MPDLVFKTDVFEGPLDLLVYMVKSKKVDVREIPISVLADEFLDYMKKMEELDIQLSSEFISTASYLMYLKSKALLPKVEEKEAEEFEKEKEKFYETIEMYSKVKEIVGEMEKRGKKSRYPVRVDRVYGIVDKLISEALRAAVKSVDVKRRVYKISREEVSIEDLMEKILSLDFPVEITEVIGKAKSRYEIVVMIVAILELIKMGKILYDNGRLAKYE